MARFLTIVLFLLQGGSIKPLPATDVTASDIQATVKQEIATNVTDIPIRTVDGGGHNVGIAVVHRENGSNLKNMALHDKVSEVYSVTEGSGTFVTGGVLENPRRREATSEVVKRQSGPGVAGTGIRGGTSRRVSKGDVIVIPAGTPHGFSDVQEPITYTVVRIDPGRVLALK